MTRISNELLATVQAYSDRQVHGYKLADINEVSKGTGIGKSKVYQLDSDQSFEMRVHDYDRQSVTVERVRGPGLIEVNDMFGDGSCYRVYGMVGFDFAGQRYGYALSET